MRIQTALLPFLVAGIIAGCSSPSVMTNVSHDSQTSTRNVSSSSELKQAIHALSAGGTIYLESGDYDDLELTISRKYQQHSPLVIQAREPGKAFIIGDTSIKVSGENVTLSGLNFERGNRSGQKWRALIELDGKNNTITQSRFHDYDLHGGVWVQLNGQYNQLTHSWFEGKRSGLNYINSDIVAEHPSYHTVSHNYFTRQKTPGINNGASAARVGHGSMNGFKGRIVFEYNLFDDQSGESEVISNKSQENIYRYNTFRNSKGVMSLRNGRGNIVYDNYFLGSGQSGQGGLMIRDRDQIAFNNYFYQLTPRTSMGDEGVITLGSASPEEPERFDAGWPSRLFPVTSNVLVAHNTIINTTGSGIVLGGNHGKSERYLAPDSIYIVNNLIGSPSHQAVLTNGTPEDITYQDNYFSGTRAGVSDDGMNIYKSDVVDILPGLPSLQQPSVAVAPALSQWLARQSLDTDWIEHARFVRRVMQQPAVAGFSPPEKTGWRTDRPFTKADVGPDWMVKQ